MNESMEAEFDTVAGWTAEIAVELGPDFYLPAACRGSGSPIALQWLIDRLDLVAADRLLDCGAGAGGPAAFAVARSDCDVVLTDPEALACSAAVRLFGLPAVQADSALPFAGQSFDAVWSLGVLCTVDDQPALLAELRRVLTPDGRLGLLVFVAQAEPLFDVPEGNNFPTAARLAALLDEARFVVQASIRVTELEAPPKDWSDRADRVEKALAQRHHGDPAWERADHQSELIGALLKSGDVVGTLIVARPQV